MRSLFQLLSHVYYAQNSCVVFDSILSLFKIDICKLLGYSVTLYNSKISEIHLSRHRRTTFYTATGIVRILWDVVCQSTDSFTVWPQVLMVE